MSDALNVEHEIQRQLLARLHIDWTPGEPFYALVENEIVRLRERLAESEAENDQWQKKLAEVWAETKKILNQE